MVHGEPHPDDVSRLTHHHVRGLPGFLLFHRDRAPLDEVYGPVLSGADPVADEALEQSGGAYRIGPGCEREQSIPAQRAMFAECSDHRVEGVPILTRLREWPFREGPVPFWPQQSEPAVPPHGFSDRPLALPPVAALIASARRGSPSPANHR